MVDLNSVKVTGSIKRLNERQGVVYITKHQEILVANGGTGECGFYSAVTLKKTGSIKLTDDADDMRYDAETDIKGFLNNNRILLMASCQAVNVFSFCSGLMRTVYYSSSPVFFIFMSRQ